jgi:hypothetical protein
LTIRTYVRKFTACMKFGEWDTYDQHLQILMPGKQVTVIGEIKRIEHNSILLVNCKIARG